MSRELITQVTPTALKPHPSNEAIYGRGSVEDLAEMIRNADTA